MTSAKRLIIATLMGAVSGIICFLLASSGHNALSEEFIFNIILSRTLIGFVIGISGIKLGWFLHGLLLGFIVGLPMAVTSTFSNLETSFTPQMMFFTNLLIGGFYGILIEFVTSVIFKAKMKEL